MKIKLNVLMVCGLLIPMSLFAQVGINTPKPNTSFEVRADTLNLSLPDGITPPKLTGDQLSKKTIAKAYGTEQAGAIIYLSAAPTSIANADSVPGVSITSIPGFYFFDGSTWVAISSGSNAASAWYNKTTGTPSFNVNDSVYHLSVVGIGTTTPDSMLTVKGGANIANDIVVNTLNIGLGGGQLVNNTGLGYQALGSNTTGDSNTAVGYQALFSNKNGFNNTAMGYQVLASNTSGRSNTAQGYNALTKLSTGSFNTAIGSNSQESVTSGQFNTSIGARSLANNTTGVHNTAMGFSAMNSNQKSINNTAVGSYSQEQNIDGDGNVSVGANTLRFNTSGKNNVAIGLSSLESNQGDANTALGYKAGFSNDGFMNTFMGYLSGDTLSGSSGNKNIFIGTSAGKKLSAGGGNVVIGAIDSKTIGVDPLGTKNAIYLGTGGQDSVSLADGLLRMKIDSVGSTQFFGTLSALSSIVATASTDPLMADGITAPILTGDELFAKNTAYTIAQKGSMIYLSAAPTSTSTQVSGITVASSAGYYYYDGTQWQSFGNKVSDTASAWFSTSTKLASMSVNDTVYHWKPVGIGTDIPDSMLTVEGGARITNDIQVHNMTVGVGGGQNLSNTALGYQALDSNTTGQRNSAVGYQALASNTIGNYNTAQGYLALTKLSTGLSNTAIGANSQVFNTSGSLNTSIGANSLQNNTFGGHNTAIGYNAMFRSTEGELNTAVGASSQEYNKKGSENVSVGQNSLRGADSAFYNVAIGNYSLESNQGNANTALGYKAGLGNDGFMNTFIGYVSGDSTDAGILGNKNIFIGTGAGKRLSAGGGNVIIGAIDSKTLGVDSLGTKNAIYLGTGGQDSASLADGLLRMKIDSAGATQFFGTLSAASSIVATASTDPLMADGITAPILTGDELFAKNTAYTYSQKGSMIYLSASPTSTSTQASGITVASDSGYYYFDGTQWQSFGNKVSDTASAWFSTSTNLASMSVKDTVYHLNPVGIGITTPDSMLTVVGGARITNDIVVNTLNMGLGGGQLVTNTGLGYQALDNNTTGDSNTAMGYQALASNTTGYGNAAVGSHSLQNNTTGFGNAAVGSLSLQNNTTGFGNAAVGSLSLENNTTGEYNVGVGYRSLNTNVDGNNNTAVGYGSAQKNTAGSGNTALGFQSLFNNTTGQYNTALGNLALFKDTLGSNNTALGYQAGAGNRGSANIFIGSNTGNKDQNTGAPGDANIFMGTNAGSGMSSAGGNVIIGSLDSSNSALDPGTANSIYLGTGGTANSLADGLLRMKIDGAGATQFYGTLSALSSMVATASADPLMADGITAPILSGDELFAKNGAYNAEQKGSMIYLSAAPTSTSTQGSGITMASDSGYYYFDGTQWQSFGNKVSDTASAWFSTSTNLASMSVNDTVYHLNPVAIGTTTPDSMLTVVGGARITNDIQVHTMTVGLGGGQDSTNTALGYQVLSSNTTGKNNTAIGSNALKSATVGQNNTAIGSNALKSATEGSNTAVGFNTLANNTTGTANTAVGISALLNSLMSRFNTAVGYNSQSSNISGEQNTSIGFQSLQDNISGNENVAIGYNTLKTNKGLGNTALGTQAGYANDGFMNTFIGYYVGDTSAAAVLGDKNIFIGTGAGKRLSAGGGNVIIGAIDSKTLGVDSLGTKNAIYLGTGGQDSASLADGLLRMRIDSAGATQFYGTLSALSSMVATASADPQMADGITAPILSGDELFAKNGAYNAEQKGSMIYLSAAPTSTSTQGSGITIASDSGYYYFDGTQWQQLAIQPSDSASAWFSTSTNLASMSVYDTVYHLNPVAIGTTTPDSMLTVVGGARITNDIQVHTMTVGLGGGQDSTNTALGYQALDSNTTGQRNSAVGYQALISNTTGLGNTAQGYLALTKLSSGILNTAVGSNSLSSLTSGVLNTSIGANSLQNNTSGGHNTAVGYNAMLRSTEGEVNTAVGVSSQESNKKGSENVSVGQSSLRLADSAFYNVAIGNYSLESNQGNANTALGYKAGSSNDGFMNTFIGYASGDSTGLDIHGNKNIFIGPGAGSGLSQEGGNVVIGALDATTLGVDVPGTKNAIYLGTGGQDSASLADGILRMAIDSAGATQFYGSVTSISAFYSNSDRRLKTNIQDITLPENFIDLIKPVVYDKKSSMDATNYSFHEYGFIAQDIQKLFPSMVNKANDKDGTLSISYTQLIPVLTKVLQDQKKTIKEQEANIKKQEANITQQQADIDQLRKELNEIKAALMNK